MFQNQAYSWRGYWLIFENPYDVFVYFCPPQKTQKMQKYELPIMEAFYTIQGEGFYNGHPAYFIRLGGCDVGCVWCDVKESWEANNHPKLPLNLLISEAKKYPSRLVVVTGGEPLMYDLNELSTQFQNENFRTHLETSGVYPVTGKWDWICFSPKKFRKPHAEIYNLAHELKIIIYHPSDFKWAETHAQKVSSNCHLSLQVEWSKSTKLLPEIIDYVKDNPKWKISLQTHKYMDIP